MADYGRGQNLQANPEAKKKQREFMVRRDPDTGMITQVPVGQETLYQFFEERRRYGNNAVRVNSYFEALLAKAGEAKKIDYEARSDYQVKPNCGVCNDFHLVNVPTVTEKGFYDFAYQCKCAKGNLTCECGCRSVQNVSILDRV